MRVGVLGGTFDPIHTGHLIIAEEARVEVGLDEVVFVPAGRPWLKDHQPRASSQHRLEMVGLAIGPNRFFRCSDREVKRPGISYTVDTLEELRGELPRGAELFFILGLDLLLDFHRWQRAERILELATLVTVVRPGNEGLRPGKLPGLRAGAEGRVRFVEGPLVDISSTEIRRRVAAGLSIRYLVPPGVEDYIATHRLYQGEELSSRAQAEGGAK